MKVQLLRHATCFLYLNGKKILLDPVLSAAGAMTAIPKVPNTSANPLVNLPDIPDMLDGIDAILITHMHRDHFDDTAKELLPKHIPVFCQPVDSKNISESGFQKVRPVENAVLWDAISFSRTRGRHGTGLTGQRMGPVSGYVLKAGGEPVTYVTGDTIWCPQVLQAIQEHNPEVIICYAGCAQFHVGRPITMSVEDVHELCSNAPNAEIIIVHMEAWNHCRLTRSELQGAVYERNFDNRVHIPFEGEFIELY